MLAVLCIGFTQIKPRPSLRDGTLAFFPGSTRAGAWPVYYPVENEIVTYHFPERLCDISLYDGSTVLAVAPERGKLVLYDLADMQSHDVCDLAGLAQQLDALGFSPTNDRTAKEKTVPERLSCIHLWGDSVFSFVLRDAYEERFLNVIGSYDIDRKKLEIIGSTSGTGYLVQNERIIYNDSAEDRFVSVNGNDLKDREVMHDRTSLKAVSDSGVWIMATRDDLINLESGVTLRPFPLCKGETGGFVFSKDDRYLAFYDVVDELLHGRVIHVCIYDIEADRLYTCRANEQPYFDASIERNASMRWLEHPLPEQKEKIAA